MTAFTAFEDERLDANLAAILRLPDTAAAADPVGGATSPLHRVRGSRRASVNVVTALGIALGGAIVALIAGRNDTSMSTDAPGNPDMRKVIDLGGPAVIQRPFDGSPVVTDTVGTVKTVRSALPRHRPIRASLRIAATAERPATTPLPLSPNDEASAPSAPVGTKVAMADGPATIAAGAIASLPAVAPAPVPSPSATDGTASTGRDRRASVDAIRSLRRQW